MNADKTLSQKDKQIRVNPRDIRVHPRAFFAMVAVPLALACGGNDSIASRGDVDRVVDIPSDTRIRVEIINTTNQRGLARRAMFFLRDQGFDVVRYSSGSPARDSTQVVLRAGQPEWAELVAKALGVTRVAAEPDSARYLEVTVYLGRDWRPPAKPFYP
jgi:hypothetical protein